MKRKWTYSKIRIAQLAIESITKLSEYLYKYFERKSD